LIFKVEYNSSDKGVVPWYQMFLAPILFIHSLYLYEPLKWN